MLCCLRLGCFRVAGGECECQTHRVVKGQVGLETPAHVITGFRAGHWRPIDFHHLHGSDGTQPYARATATALNSKNPTIAHHTKVYLSDPQDLELQKQALLILWQIEQR